MRHTIAEKSGNWSLHSVLGRDVDYPDKAPTTNVLPGLSDLGCSAARTGNFPDDGGWDCASGRSLLSGLASILLGCIRDYLASVYR